MSSVSSRLLRSASSEHAMWPTENSAANTTSAWSRGWVPAAAGLATDGRPGSPRCTPAERPVLIAPFPRFTHGAPADLAGGWPCKSAHVPFKDRRRRFFARPMVSRTLDHGPCSVVTGTTTIWTSISSTPVTFLENESFPPYFHAMYASTARGNSVDIAGRALREIIDIWRTTIRGTYRDHIPGANCRTARRRRGRS